MMKLGTETGSLVNHVMSRTQEPKPEVGMGATVLLWSDRQACTIIEVSKSGRRIKVQRDRAIRTDTNGMGNDQSYRYEPNPEGATDVYSLRKDGRWKQLGYNHPVLSVGHRSEFYDFSF